LIAPGKPASASARADRPAAPIRLGIAGLGLAGAFMIRAAAAYPRIALCAAMDPLEHRRQAFARDFGARTYEHFEDLCSDPSIEAIYIASPHRYHARQAVEALQHGKHVLVEKPLALTLEDCDHVIEAAERTGLNVIVGHTHAFDPNIRHMRALIESGEVGRLGMILCLNYNDFLLRPHRQEEFDSPASGGIAFNQVIHQIEIIRLLGGGLVASVRATMGALDQARAGPGHCAAFLEFDNGAAATLAYSGYDFFDSDEWHDWIAEGGARKEPGRHGEARRAFYARQGDTEMHRNLGYGGRALSNEQPHLPHFGLIVVTCERGDLRLCPNGVTIHGIEGTRQLAVPTGPGRPGQGDALDALWMAIRDKRRCIHDARWAKASVEAVLALLHSAQERREVTLRFQTPVPEQTTSSGGQHLSAD
jgi:phthalate 4,5-cis-dihydrodiol dehydrogenase